MPEAQEGRECTEEATVVVYALLSGHSGGGHEEESNAEDAPAVKETGGAVVQGEG